MTTMELLEDVKALARKDETVRAKLFAAKEEKDPVFAFSAVCRKLGFEIYPMDLVNVGEEFYAAMRRSTNGGGENSPLLEGEDDFFELFFVGL
ncbi:MAG: hypothetical protein Q4B01_09485 [Eubacteriales bacterium]|nr:hypothetical protein [Eubacteriales bacterium]